MEPFPESEDTGLKKVLNPTVLRLGFISFLQDLSSEMLYPIAPIFLTSVLGANMAAVGFIEGVAEAISSLLKGFAGSWSDRSGNRRRFIAVGYGLATLAKPLTGLATSWVHVLFARGLDRTGKGIRTAPRDAMLADAVPAELKGTAFGWHRAMDTAGAALGPLIALGILHFHTDDLRSLYFYAFIPGVLATLMVLTLPETGNRLRAQAHKVRLGWKDLPQGYRKFMLAWGVFSLGNSSDAFLLLKMKEGGLNLSSMILIYCFYNLIYASFSPWLGGGSDRWGKKKTLVGGIVLFSLIYLGFGLGSGLWVFVVLYALYGLYMASTEGVSKAFVVDLMHSDLKATGLGFFGLVTGLSSIVGGTMMGVLWDQFGSKAAFFTTAALGFLSVLVLSILRIEGKASGVQ